MQIFTVFQFLGVLYFPVKMLPYGSQMGTTSMVINTNNFKHALEEKTVYGTSITVLDQSLQAEIHFPP